MSQRSIVKSVNPTDLQDRNQIPVLLIGHGSRDAEGRQAVVELAEAYRTLNPSRPVVPCFLELTSPTIADGVEECDRQGYREVVALPVLLFGARHNKFDITNELDALQPHYPHITFHYGGPIGITPSIIELLHHRLASLLEHQQPSVPPDETVLVFVGRGSSDPDANGEACKLARMVWEGTGCKAVEVCFIGIAHPRLPIGLERALLLKPKRIVVLPYFLFTGVLVKKIQAIAQQWASVHPDIDMVCLPELGIVAPVLESLYSREQQAIAGEIAMNCQLCKFRRAASQSLTHHHHHHDHHHPHESGTRTADPYAQMDSYHKRVWQLP